ncbi:hypothetical protein [Lysinibacillus sp. 3P01SB]
MGEAVEYIGIPLSDLKGPLHYSEDEGINEASFEIFFQVISRQDIET